MEEVQQEARTDTRPVEFYSYWRNMRGLEVLSIFWEDDIFADFNALSIRAMNFEIRIYFKK